MRLLGSFVEIRELQMILDLLCGFWMEGTDAVTDAVCDMWLKCLESF